MQIIAENDRGFLGLDGNELVLGSKVPDPAKLRGTAPVNADGGGGFVISANLSRHAGVAIDGHDMVEMGMLRWEQAGDVRGQVGNPKCEINFMLNDGGGDSDSNMFKPLAFVWNAVTRIIPDFATALRGALGGVSSTTFTPPGGFPNKLVSPDGRLELDIQNADAAGLVAYMDGKPIWSAEFGWLKK